MVTELTKQLLIIIPISVLIAGIIVLIIIRLINSRKKKKKLPDHIELYFDENFRNIIDEWDLVSRPKMKTWKKDMSKKLDIISNDINSLKSKQNKATSRIKLLEKNITSLEEF